MDEESAGRRLAGFDEHELAEYKKRRDAGSDPEGPPTYDGGEPPRFIAAANERAKRLGRSIDEVLRDDVDALRASDSPAVPPLLAREEPTVIPGVVVSDRN